MPQPALWRPIAVLAAGLAAIIAMLARTEGAQSLPRYDEYEVQQTMTAYILSQNQPAAQQPAATAAPTWTPTATATATATPSPTLSPTAFVQPAIPTPIPTTPTPTPSGALACTPGTTILIEGSGPPRAPVLLLFGTRVVGGGSVSQSGTFTLPLTIGVERPGQYQLTVRIRGTDTILRKVDCGVPPVTPTALPTRRPAP